MGGAPADAWITGARTLRERLRSDTRGAHERLETAFTWSPFTRGEYARFLRMLAAVYLPFESELEGAAELRAIVPDLDERRRGRALRADLETLGLAAPRPRDLGLGDRAAQLGALYVFEGATLGGVVIEERVRMSGDTLAPGATRFVSGYRDRNREMWGALVARLADAPLDGEAAARCTDAARRTFEHLLDEAARRAR